MPGMPMMTRTEIQLAIMKDMPWVPLCKRDDLVAFIVDRQKEVFPKGEDDEDCDCSGGEYDQDTYDEGYDEGYIEGKQVASEKAYARGHEDGYNEGYNDGQRGYERNYECE
jgi:flagellar biosynthesis/type III secretory pathway protein FliH